jgi:hypothetical protein
MNSDHSGIAVKISPSLIFSRIDATSVAILGGIALVFAVVLAGTLLAAGGHLVYPIEAPYVHLTLGDQIADGHYGLVAGEPAAPSSTILYPFLLAALSPLGFGVALPLVINVIATFLAGIFALLLADECGVPLRRIRPVFIFVLAAVITLALNLVGLAFTGLEHSLHAASSVAYVLGLARFVRRNRCDWWWFVCIIVQPLLRFEGAGMLLADALIFVSFRRYDYALAVVAIGLALVGGYSLFLHSMGLPLLPSSVLARSDWSNAAVGSNGGVLAAITGISRNFYHNLNCFGAAQILGGVALAWIWVSRSRDRTGGLAPDRRERVKLMLAFFLTFVSLAQIAGGKLGWTPPRYEAYVLVLNLCALAVIYREAVVGWCERVNWRRAGSFAIVLLLIFAGYATQTLAVPAKVRREYLGPFQLRRFVTDFYQRPVAVDQIGYINYDNPNYVLDLSGLSSEAVRIARASQSSTGWMDDFLSNRHVGLAIIDSANTPLVPVRWTLIAELRMSGDHADAVNHILFYARRPEDADAISTALTQFAGTMPKGERLIWAERRGQGA